MPELPEVETTTRGLQEKITGLKILDVWTDLSTKDKRKEGTVADPKFFKVFKKKVLGTKVLNSERRAKNILINLTGGSTILVHLKMTGHLLYGKYTYDRKSNKWAPKEDGPLKDPFNRFVHVVFTFSNGKHLAFSDTRKFGKMTLLETKIAHESKHLSGLGPEPLEKTFTERELKTRLHKKPNGKIKTVLMDQSILTGVGNIYSDEILWRACVHPERKVNSLNNREVGMIFMALKQTLTKGIDFGGDSMSDYRNIHGERGSFQLHHEAYKRKGARCRKKGCVGVIMRKIINGRSAHFCSRHQK